MTTWYPPVLLQHSGGAGAQDSTAGHVVLLGIELSEIEDFTIRI